MAKAATAAECYSRLYERVKVRSTCPFPPNIIIVSRYLCFPPGCIVMVLVVNQGVDFDLEGDCFVKNHNECGKLGTVISCFKD